jgi:hypothetical protein
VSGGMSRAVTYDIEVLGEDVIWFMQYSGFAETTVLSLFTKTASNPTWKKKHANKASLGCSSGREPACDDV